MRPASLTLPLLAAALIGACGGDAADAEETVSAAISGIAAGDADGVCSKLTPAAEKKVIVALRNNPVGANIRAKSCEEALKKLHAGLTEAQRNVLIDGAVEDVRVNGDKATVHVVGAGMDVELQKRNDTWLITGGFFN